MRQEKSHEDLFWRKFLAQTGKITPHRSSAAGRDGLADTATDGGLVFLGNFDVDVEHQQRIGHLFGPLPPEMQAE